jgi:hypothetical protein
MSSTTKFIPTCTCGIFSLQISTCMHWIVPQSIIFMWSNVHIIAFTNTIRTTSVAIITKGEQNGHRFIYFYFQTM